MLSKINTNLNIFNIKNVKISINKTAVAKKYKAEAVSVSN